jgi:hypothetical protein
MGRGNPVIAVLVVWIGLVSLNSFLIPSYYPPIARNNFIVSQKNSRQHASETTPLSYVGNKTIPLRFDDACPPQYDMIVPILSTVERYNGACQNASQRLYTYNPTIQHYSYQDFIVSFRVGTKPPNSDDYLGLAIVNQRLQVKQHLLIDLNRHVQLQYKGKKRPGRTDQFTSFSDFRLVRHHSTSHSYYFVTHALNIIVLEILPDSNSSSNLPILFHSGLSVRAVSPMRKIRRVNQGRNFNLFYTNSSNNDSSPVLLLEEWPLPTPRYLGGGRTVSQIDVFDDWRFHATQQWTTQQAPVPSWRGPEQAFTKRTSTICDDRGTACCVKLEQCYYQDLVDVDASFVWIGISHVKSWKRVTMSHGTKYAYLSRFYAVLPKEPPTTLVAQSGLFCWTQSNLTQELEWNGARYQCPVIQFPSGMLDDGKFVIVAYGVNDESSRIVRIKKRDIALRLFAPDRLVKATTQH